MSGFEEIRNVGCPGLWLMNELTISYAAVLQGGHDVEDAASPERVAAIGRHDDRKPASVSDGIGVDEEWEHQRIFEGSS